MGYVSVDFQGQVSATPIAAQRAALAKQGYLVLQNLTDAEDLQHCKRLLEPLFEGRVGFKEGRQFDMTGADDAGSAPRLPQIIAPRRYEPELELTRTFAAARTLARELLGPDAELTFDHVIKKPAFDGAVTPWHQDEAFRDPAHFYEEISIWVPLQPVNSQNGCMRFVPLDGSGKVHPHRAPEGGDRVNALACYAGFDPADAIDCPLDLGGCTVHTGRTIHGAGPNLTSEPRYAYIMVFERPSVKRTQPRSFPWREDMQSARLERRKEWLRRGGLFVLMGRKIRVAARLVRRGQVGGLITETKSKLKVWVRDVAG